MNEVKITSFTQQANLYRNLRREEVDKLFSQRTKWEIQIKNEKSSDKPDESKIAKYQQSVDYFDNRARKLWREIITIANKM